MGWDLKPTDLPTEMSVWEQTCKMENKVSVAGQILWLDYRLQSMFNSYFSENDLYDISVLYATV